MYRAGLLMCAVAALVLAQATASISAQASEVRALWVLRSSLESSDAIRRMVMSAAANGFNTLFVQTPLGEPPVAAFDPLAETLAQARMRGVRVHAWIDVTMVSSASEFPRPRDHILYQHPDWLMVPRELAPELLVIDPGSPEYLGRLARWSRGQGNRVQGLYVSPVHAGASQQLAAAVGEIVARYPLDGVHLDQLSFPGLDFDYSRVAIERFRQLSRPALTAAERARIDAIEAIDPFAYPNELAEEWRLFRQSQLTALVTRLYTTIKRARPTAVVSAAVIPSAVAAQQDRLQDWRTWVENGFVDVLCPIAYTDALAQFIQEIGDAQGLAGGRPVWAGIGAHRLSASATVDNITAARRLGTAGVILFSYDSIASPQNGTDYLTAIARAFAGAL